MQQAAGERHLDAELMARMQPLVWFTGAAVFLGVILTGGANPDVTAPLLAIDAIAWVMAVTMFVGRDRLPDWFEEFAQYVGIAIVSAGIAVNGDTTSFLALFYLWLAVQAAYFTDWRRASVQGAAMAIGYYIALLIAGEGSLPVVRWVMLVATAFVIGALVAYMRERVNSLVAQLNAVAETDELTGLGNRRLLLGDLERATEVASPERPWMLALYDLDGFKAYNDLYGHPAGDAMLRRLGRTLADAVKPAGVAYRLGGDEFCVLADISPADSEPLIAAGCTALTAEGEGFEVGASCGSVMMPAEAHEVSDALRTADQRMYAAKGSRAGASERQARDLLLRVLDAREPELRERHRGLGEMATAVGKRLQMSSEDLDVLSRAAELHDIGKIGIPEGVLGKAGPLDQLEREMVETHPLIGQRILSAAPAMAPVARLVRSSHERWDGTGYPEGLAGEEIPLGSRIILVCNAFQAMTSERSYGRTYELEEALDELRANSGGQFDGDVVEQFCTLMSDPQQIEAFTRT
jgi:diguanylate cyclase (GGDEF)-like protein